LGLGFDYGVCDLALIDADISIPAFLPQQPALHLVNRLLRNDATALPAVLALILEHHLQEARPLPEPVVRMRDRIRTHGLTPITAADLAHISGLGTSRAWEIFRHHLGCTPRQALERRRCAVAAAMLTQGMSVTSVTTRCGFGDRGTFARAFARIHGTTPSAWQRRKH
jgi:AraC-like DNA-binding protein